jgi:hypothetical protein
LDSISHEGFEFCDKERKCILKTNKHCYRSTLATSTLIILFVGKLKFLKIFFFFSKNKSLRRNLKNLLKYCEISYILISNLHN